jgi:adenylate cyclase
VPNFDINLEANALLKYPIEKRNTTKGQIDERGGVKSENTTYQAHHRSSKGFTAASERLTAQELVAEINNCFEAFDRIMDKYNIEKIKTIGDAYMAAGGLPVPADDSVKNTVLAALEMQAFISQRKVDMNGLPAFEMHLGIHTGPVVAGIVGVKIFAYDIWGDTVNIASCMESSGGVGQVNVSEDTYELLKEDFDFTFENRGKIEAKGKGEIEIFY